MAQKSSTTAPYAERLLERNRVSFLRVLEQRKPDLLKTMESTSKASASGQYTAALAWAKEYQLGEWVVPYVLARLDSGANTWGTITDADAAILARGPTRWEAREPERHWRERVEEYAQACRRRGTEITEAEMPREGQELLAKFRRLRIPEVIPDAASHLHQQIVRMQLGLTAPTDGEIPEKRLNRAVRIRLGESAEKIARAELNLVGRKASELTERQARNLKALAQTIREDVDNLEKRLGLPRRAKLQPGRRRGPATPVAPNGQRQKPAIVQAVAPLRYYQGR